MILGTLAVAALATVPLVARQGASPYPPAKPEAAAPTGTAARGAQLAMLGGCHDCHTPKLQNGAPDMSRPMSGHPENAPLAPDVTGGVSTNMLLTSWRGPWGVSLARNLTPDMETGIGKWSYEEFRKTIRTGINPKGEVILPPMPIAHAPEPPGKRPEGDLRLPADLEAGQERRRTRQRHGEDRTLTDLRN